MYYKRIYCLFLLSLPLFAAQENLSEQKTEQTIHQIYHNLHKKPALNISERITNISGQFLGKPYLLGALGEGERGDYDQWPLYRTDAFDCETYVDTVLALALANSPHHFKHCINQIRYRDGQVSFITRNHFTCLDWNQNNQHQGFVKDITTTLHDAHHQSVVKFARALIDKPSWYRHMSKKRVRLHPINPVISEKSLASLKREGAKLPQSTSIIPYIPLTALFNHSGQANRFLFNQIPNAALIEIIRPNWDLNEAIGTHLNVSHIGFAIWKKGILFFRQASSSENQVVDVPLINYLHEALKSPTIKGINIQIVTPQIGTC